MSKYIPNFGLGMLRLVSSPISAEGHVAPARALESYLSWMLVIGWNPAYYNKIVLV